MCACRDDHHSISEKLVLSFSDKCILQLLIFKCFTHRQVEMRGKEAQSISEKPRNLLAVEQIHRHFSHTLLSQLPQYSATKVVIF